MTFLKKVETALYPYALPLAGDEGQAIALSHQWAHGIAYDSGLVGCPDKKKLQNILKEAGLYESRIQFAESLTKEVAFPPVEKPSFRFIDLFAGIGGFRLGLQSIGGQCVFSSEWDRPAADTYYRNYGLNPVQ